MRKSILVAVSVLAFASAHAQGFRAGVSGGLPVGDASNFTSVALSADLAYLFGTSGAFSVGPTVGYTAFFKENSNGHTISFLPIAAAGRVSVSPDFTLGLDAGYGVGVRNNSQGAFYLSPKVQYAVANPLDVVLGYKGLMKKGNSFGQVYLGVEFKL